MIRVAEGVPVLPQPLVLTARAVPLTGAGKATLEARAPVGPGAAHSGACSLLPGKDLRVGCCSVTLPAGTESHVSPQASAKLQETERTLRDQEGVLKALTLERDQAVQALRTRGLLPEKEVQVSASAVLPEPPQEHSSLLEPSLSGGRGRTGPHRPQREVGLLSPIPFLCLSPPRGQSST